MVVAPDSGSESKSEGYEQWFAREEHPVLYQRFSPHARESMFEDDLAAGRYVPLLLAAVITVGVLMAVFSVVVISG